MRWLLHAENAISVTALVAMAALPVLEMALRLLFSKGIPGVTGYVQHLTLWVGFLGAMLASREQRHLNLATGNLKLPGHWGTVTRTVSSVASTAVATGLCWAAFQFVRWEMETPTRIGGWLPMWVAEAVLPISFFFITLRFIASAGGWTARAWAVAGVALAAGVGLGLESHASQLLWPGAIALLLAALAGAPIFVILGGLALVLFFADGVPVAAIPVETYRIIVSPAIPTIPLFTLTGYLLAEGQASRRLVRLFTALFGWMPGGLAVAATLVCAFFATFTGASGVTILALGGLLLPVLIQSGYPQRFSTGLLTATGSIGLLFPPSLAVILYGVVARVPIPDMFVAGIIPGLIMVGVVAIYGVMTGVRARVPRPPFDPREAAAAIWESKWEVLLPVVALGSIFGGFATLAEAAAITVVYALLTQTVIHRDLHPLRDVPGVVVHCATLVGGVFVILGCAMGLTNYLVDAEVPMLAAEWVKAHIDSKLLFLLALNVFLLLVGCLMDIFSALAVVVPLILPMAKAFDIHPLHLGMIFLINLELGYLTPPVGMNLFLASYRFERPLLEMYRAALPYLMLLGMVVLLVTYFPILIIGVP
ncbi:MAG: TRAP transporter large permease subunit [Nitrospirota bacterium]|nr:TRAP transporter large permease subunit [Nitrospirota bacterium]